MARKFNKKTYKKKLDTLWSLIVRGRDKRCLICGREDNLQAHHAIIRKGQSNSTRWDTRNGVALCYYCHMCQLHALAELSFVEKYTKLLHEKIPQEIIDEIRLEKKDVLKDNQFTLEQVMERLLKEKQSLTSTIDSV